MRAIVLLKNFGTQSQIHLSSKIFDINLPNDSNDKRLINEVATQLQQILPTLSYGLCSKISNKRDEEAAANTALAWYQQQKITKSATENVVQALDNEHISNPCKIQDLINTCVKQAVDQKVASTETKLKKNIEKKLTKKHIRRSTNEPARNAYLHSTFCWSPILPIKHHHTTQTSY